MIENYYWTFNIKVWQCIYRRGFDRTVKRNPSVSTVKGRTRGDLYVFGDWVLY